MKEGFDLNVQGYLGSRQLSIPLLALMLLCGAAVAQSGPSGSFGFVANAYQMDSAGKNGGALVGIMNFDGAGNVSGNAILKSRSPNGGDGPIPSTFTGTYTNNPDGTTSTTLAFDIGFGAMFAMAPTDGGQGLQFLSTDTPGAIDSLFRGQAPSLSGPLPISFFLQGATGSVPLSLTGVPSASSGLTVYTSTPATGSGPAKCPDGSTGTWAASVPAVTIAAPSAGDVSGNFLAAVTGTVCGHSTGTILSGLVAGTVSSAGAASLVLHFPGSMISGFARAVQAGGSLNGAYGFQVDSWPYPGGTIGVMNFDGAGNVTIPLTTVGVGNAAKATFTGTYSIKPDGSGTISSPGPSFFFVMTDGGSQLLLLRTDDNVDAKFNVSFGTARLQ
jgi:hypothetical protein